ncbi:MAG: tetratricopeptide repeat protein [Acidobacteria bacterium]|nr:tetratricopeptide repeat protein [Acidobacteriota bacterium]
MTAIKYPGNPSLPQEVKQRVLATFDQSLRLYEEAQLDDVVSGCDLLLEMDDQFEPARRLRAKAKDPTSAVDISDLAQYRDARLAESRAAAVPDFGAADSSPRLLEAVEAMNRGDLDTTIEICNEILASEPGNEEAAALGQKAYERQEAAPFVRQFMADAGQALDRGDRAAAETALGKAKSLDPLHPEIAAMEDRLSGSPPESAGAPPTGESASFDFGSPSASPFGGAFGGDSGSSAFETFSNDSPDPSPAEPGSPDEKTESPVADLGFTLENEPEAVEPEVGEARTFDFSGAGVDVSGDDQTKIAAYLSEGDAAFEAGNWTQAIDIWSRIFLIDVTNDEASSRIEKARERKKEEEARTDEILNAGIAAFDRGDYVTARQSFEEVLAEEPDSFKAQEYLDKLDAHAATSGAAAIPPPPAASGDMYEGPDLSDEDSLEPSAGPRRPGVPPVAPAKPEKSSKGLLIVAALVAVVAVGGWFAWSMISGGEATESEVSSTITQGKLNRAEMLAGQGSFDDAIELLSSIQPGDPFRDQAIEKIAEYRAQAASMIDGRPAAEVREELLVEAREAFAAEDFIGAKRAFEEAAQIAPLDASDSATYQQVSAEVSGLEQALLLFNQGNYRETLRAVSAFLAREPDNPNAQRLAASANYNLGVNALKDENTSGAIEYFTEAVRLDPDDIEAQRALELARRYDGASKDLLYRIFVKYLTAR